MKSELEQHREYYSRTAKLYDQWHVNTEGAHDRALAFMVGLLDRLDTKSILDVGSGTGRALLYIKERRPDIRVLGVEPVRELRDIAYAKGLDPAELIDGDARELAFGEGEFDLVCEFGVLHHIRETRAVLSEMLRVGRQAIFLSDENYLAVGQGSKKLLKKALYGARLWGLVSRFRSGRNGYNFSEGDGLSYPYSVFEDFGVLRDRCSQIHVLNTDGDGTSPMWNATHVAILGIKDDRLRN